MNLKTAKEMWDTLEVTHGDTNEVKVSRIVLLRQNLEMSKMLPNEGFERFFFLVLQLLLMSFKFLAGYVQVES